VSSRESSGETVFGIDYAESDRFIPYRRRDDGSIDVDATVEDLRHQLTRDYEGPEVSRLLSRRRRRKFVALTVQQNRELLEYLIARGDLR